MKFFNARFESPPGHYLVIGLEAESLADVHRIASGNGMRRWGSLVMVSECSEAELGPSVAERDA